MAFLPYHDQQRDLESEAQSQESLQTESQRHGRLANQSTEQKVKELKYNLFNNEVNKQQAMSYLKSKVNDSDSDKIYLVAARLIGDKTDEVSARDIDEQLLDAENDIHAWSNKAVYCERIGEREEAASAFKTVLKLHRNPVSVAKAKTLYAFWIAARNRSEQHRMKACELLDEVVFHNADDTDLEMKAAIDNAASLYFTVIIRYIASEFGKGKNAGWHKSKIRKAVDVIITLIHSKKYINTDKAILWLSVAELLQLPNLSNDPSEELKQELTRLQVELNLPRISFEVCMENIIEICCRYGINVDTKVVARAAKLATSLAFDSQINSNVYEKRLIIAIQLSEKALSLGMRPDKANWALGKCCMALWAMKMYDGNKMMVDEEHKEMFGTPLKSETKARAFIGGGLCLIKEGNMQFKQNYLSIAHDHWEEMEQLYGSEWDRTSKLARLKYILNKPDDEVESTFLNAVSCVKSNDKDFSPINAHQLFGRFYEKTGRTDMAIEQYLEAKAAAVGNKGNANAADYRLKALNQDCQHKTRDRPLSNNPQVQRGFSLEQGNFHTEDNLSSDSVDGYPNRGCTSGRRRFRPHHRGYPRGRGHRNDSPIAHRESEEAHESSETNAENFNQFKYGMTDNYDKQRGNFRGCFHRGRGGFDTSTDDNRPPTPNRDDHMRGGFRGEHTRGGFRGEHMTGGFRGKHTKGGFRGEHTRGGFRGEHTRGGFRGEHTRGGFRGEHTRGGFRGRGRRRAGGEHRRGGHQGHHSEFPGRTSADQGDYEEDSDSIADFQSNLMAALQLQNNSQ